MKHRDAKPFALMARDLDVDPPLLRASTREAERVLTSPEAPIVLLPADGPELLPEAVAPGLRTLGFMLPTTPLHLLMLRRMTRPVVMTSGNLSDEPQVIDEEDARERLAAIAPYALIHDRAIANRIDDSVVRDHGRAHRGCCAARAAMRPPPSRCRRASRRRRSCLPWAAS